MATTRILLDPYTAVLPTVNPPARQTVSSSATEPENGSRPIYYKLNFDQSTDETCYWNFRLPADYASGGTVILQWTSSVTTGNVIWKAAAGVSLSDVTDTDALVQNAVVTSSATAVPTTVGYWKETSLVLTMTNAVAGCWLSIMVGRDADAAGDTAAGDCAVIAAEFSYTGT